MPQLSMDFLSWQRYCSGMCLRRGIFLSMLWKRLVIRVIYEQLQLMCMCVWIESEGGCIDKWVVMKVWVCVHVVDNNMQCRCIMTCDPLTLRERVPGCKVWNSPWFGNDGLSLNWEKSSWLTPSLWLMVWWTDPKSYERTWLKQQ